MQWLHSLKSQSCPTVNGCSSKANLSFYRQSRKQWWPLSFCILLHTKAFLETFWTFYCLHFVNRLYQLHPIEISKTGMPITITLYKQNIFQVYLSLLIFSFDLMDCVLFPSTWIYVKMYQYNRCEYIMRTNYINQKSIEWGKVSLVFNENSSPDVKIVNYEFHRQWNNSESLGRNFPPAPC